MGEGGSVCLAVVAHLSGNVAFVYLFPNPIAFRDPNFLSRSPDGVIGERLRNGYSFPSAIALDDDLDKHDGL